MARCYENAIKANSFVCDRHFAGEEHGSTVPKKTAIPSKDLQLDIVQEIEVANAADGFSYEINARELTTSTTTQTEAKATLEKHPAFMDQEPPLKIKQELDDDYFDDLPTFSSNDFNARLEESSTPIIKQEKTYENEMHSAPGMESKKPSSLVATVPRPIIRVKSEFKVANDERSNLSSTHSVSYASRDPRQNRKDLVHDRKRLREESPGTSRDTHERKRDRTYRDQGKSKDKNLVQDRSPEHQNNESSAGHSQSKSREQDYPASASVNIPSSASSFDFKEAKKQAFLKNQLSLNDLLSAENKSANIDPRISRGFSIQKFYSLFEIPVVPSHILQFLVTDRVKNALAIIKNLENRKYTPKFLQNLTNGLPNFKLTEQQYKTPILLNTQNVLYRLTSKSREAILSFPFKNLNRSLFTLCQSLGADICDISKKVKKLADEEKRREQEDVTEKMISNSNCRNCAVQTDTYLCNDCRLRSLRSFKSVGLQCLMVNHTTDTASQTTKNTGGLYAEVPTMRGLSPEQIQCVKDFKRLFNCQDALDVGSIRERMEFRIVFNRNNSDEIPAVIPEAKSLNKTAGSEYCNPEPPEEKFLSHKMSVRKFETSSASGSRPRSPSRDRYRYKKERHDDDRYKKDRYDNRFKKEERYSYEDFKRERNM